MLFVGFLAPVPIAYWVIGKRRADVTLTLLGLTALPMLVWGASLGAEIGPCSVPDCMSSSQHDQFVITIVSLVLVLGAFGLLATGRVQLGGIVLVIGQVVGAYSMTKTDVVITVTLIVLAVAAAAYVIYRRGEALETPRVPDYPPPS